MADKMKNPAMAIILGRLKKPENKPPMEEEMEEEEEGSSQEAEIAAEEIIAAIENKDAAGLAEALKAFYEMCC